MCFAIFFCELRREVSFFSVERKPACQCGWLGAKFECMKYCTLSVIPSDIHRIQQQWATGLYILICPLGHGCVCFFVFPFMVHCTCIFLDIDVCLQQLCTEKYIHVCSLDVNKYLANVNVLTCRFWTLWWSRHKIVLGWEYSGLRDYLLWWARQFRRSCLSDSTFYVALI